MNVRVSAAATISRLLQGFPGVVLELLPLASATTSAAWMVFAPIGGGQRPWVSGLSSGGARRCSVLYTIALWADGNYSSYTNVHLCTFYITVASYGPRGDPRGQGRPAVSALENLRGTRIRLSLDGLCYTLSTTAA